MIYLHVYHGHNLLYQMSILRNNLVHFLFLPVLVTENVSWLSHFITQFNANPSLQN